ncbi:FecR family protein [Runella slithyformis]|uniref:Anti-FecI sigma factor, FecR n=1 Tax=Runella slithyformis (strain ATCC 29530 / DSM 19594 / LMG 11500 / NCIMB 11436 / LSU 4) TaxID=761193 RepID=A0A7U3ZHJ5_RUNSL|nr:FecR domain-containing protein [Runella slithyformis]AEI47305.1 anti-FecI sigma factor, FecR [Runella slithyformis DSM 19594]
MKTQVTKETLYNYFSGRATVFQKQMIEDWAQERQNRELFYGYLAMWEREHLQYMADPQAALERHRARMAQQNENEPKTEEFVAERRIISSRFMMAASIAFLVLLGGWVFRENLLYKTHTTAYGQTCTLKLEDGSQVVLNANSSLKVPRFGFGPRTREVYLTGEANFAVTHTANHQSFVVKTGRDFDVVVLGTEFVVNTRPAAAKVVLNKGKVQLRYQEGNAQKQLTMKPGDLVTMEVGGKANLRQIAKPQNYAAWQDHRFVFEETTLKEVAQLFEDNFGIPVEIPETELAQWTLSGSFTANNAEELLETLTEAANLSYRKEENKIIITTNP